MLLHRFVEVSTNLTRYNFSQLLARSDHQAKNQGDLFHGFQQSKRAIKEVKIEHLLATVTATNS